MQTDSSCFLFRSPDIATCRWENLAWIEGVSNNKRIKGSRLEVKKNSPTVEVFLGQPPQGTIFSSFYMQNNVVNATKMEKCVRKNTVN